MSARNLLEHRTGRLLSFGVLYISEGIPYGFTSIAMVTVMRQEGVSLERIGLFVAALFLPWAFKWAWAPLIDLIKLDHWGGRKAWVVFCTVMMILTLQAAAVVDFQAHFELLLALIVLNNLFCATQDVAIDSLAVSTLKPNERARGNGFMFAGQYLGITLGGGGAVFVYGLFGFDVALAFVSVLLLLNLLFVLFCIRDAAANPEAVREDHFLRELARSFNAFVREVYASFWRSGRGPMVGVLFALLPAGAIALAYATLGTIQVDYGLSENQIAELRVYNTVAAGLGCVSGGFLADRFGLKPTLAGAYLLTAVPTLLLGLQIADGGLGSVPLLNFYALIIAHGFCYGVAFGVHAAIFMGMTNPAVAATQFTAFMAMSNLAISVGNYWQGMVAERFDYATVFYLDALIGVLVITVIPFLREREEAPIVPLVVAEPTRAPDPSAVGELPAKRA